MITSSLIVLSCCSITSLIAGFIDAIAGGGGLLTVPVLLITGNPSHLALGTNKFSATLGTIVALRNFAKSHLILWKMALFGLIFSLLGAWLGSKLTLYIDVEKLGKIIVLLLPFGMLATVLPRKKNDTTNKPIQGHKFWIILPLICFMIGLYDGFFGPGTGSFLILAFHWILSIQLLSASATAKVVNLGSNISALIVFLVYDKIIWDIAISMAIASMLGNWIGSKLAIKIGYNIVKKCLTISLFLLFITLIWQFFLAPVNI